MSYSSEVLADSPAWYPKLDETSGTVAVDASGNGRDGTYSAGITLGATSLLADGSGKAAQFTANTSTGVILTDAAWMDFTALTFECLVNFSSAVDGLNGDALISHYGGGGISALLWRTTAGKLGLQVKVGGSIFNCNSTTSPSNGTTYHVAGTWDGSNARIYVNGTLEATTAASGSLATTSDDMRIGCYSNSASTVPGMVIDEPAVYTTALSGTRIGVHYTAATSISNPDATVNAVPFTATAAAVTPAVTASSSVAAPAASATATFNTPAVTGTGSATVFAAPFAATASVAAPALSADANPSTPAATAIAAFLAPTVSATTSATVTAVPFAAMADFLIPTVSDGSGNRTVTAPAMTATAAFLAPVWTQVLDVATDTSNARHGRRRLASATVTITRPVVAPPATLTFGTKVDKALAYPVPTMVEGRPT